MSPAKRLIAALALSTLTLGVADAQTVQIGSEASCARCAIVLENVVTLRDLTYDGPSTLIARGPAGDFYLYSDALVKTFKSDGQFRRQIGRRGGGPGEYEQPRNLLVARDGSVHLLDAQLSRYMVFSPDGKIRSAATTSVNRGIGMDAVFLADGQLVVNGIFSSMADAGYALQRIDAAGHSTLRFDEGVFDLSKKWLQRRLLWTRSDGSLLVARPYTFAIDVYAPDLTKQTTIRRVADWIPRSEPQESPSGGIFDKPFTPELTAIWEDADGLVWLLMYVPSPLWKPGPTSRPGHLPPRDEFDALAKRPRKDAIVEVIDLKRGQVFARSRIAGLIGLPFGGGYIAENVDTLQGEPVVRISRFRLKR